VRIIGREAPADIVVPGIGVSAMHLLVEVIAGNRFRVWDLGSTNGTFINGNRVKEGVVSRSDELRLGSWVLDWTAIGPLLASGPRGDQSFIIGRDPSTDLPLPDQRVSGRHAVALVRGGQILLVDLASSNGTFVNGSPIICAPVPPGSQVSLGSLQVDLHGLLVARGALIHQAAVVTTAPAVPARKPVERPADAATEVAPPGKSRKSKALLWGAVAAVVVLAVLAGLFFTGTIWPYWFRPYEDPWPTAVSRAEQQLVAAGDAEQRLQTIAGAADQLSGQLSGLKQLQPVLDRIDSWRGCKLVSGDVNGALSMLGNFTGTQLPDNIYDAVITSLDYTAPGAGQKLRDLEQLVRDALKAIGTLHSFSSQSRQLATELERFRSGPSRSELLALEREIKSVSSQLEDEGGKLKSLQNKADGVIDGAMAVQWVLGAAANTTVGGYVRQPLMEMQRFIARAIRPLDDFEQQLNQVTGELPQQIGKLQALTFIADEARASDALQLRHHAKGMTAR